MTLGQNLKMFAENKMWRGASGASLRHQLTIFSLDIFLEEIARNLWIFWRLAVREHLMLCLSFVVMMPLIPDHLQKNILLTRNKLKVMILIFWKSYRSGLFAGGQLKVMIICQNNCRTRASSLKGGTLWNNYMALIWSIVALPIQENPKFLAD